MYVGILNPTKNIGGPHRELNLQRSPYKQEKTAKEPPEASMGLKRGIHANIKQSLSGPRGSGRELKPPTDPSDAPGAQ